ncbi:MAG: VWA domain-containing protein [Myxococcota bacterium]|nr:VWA domain-containing protein [Myxococcota bacterium]
MRPTMPPQEPLFLEFFYLLREAGLTVSSREWLMFIESLSKGLVAADFYRFYAIARATLIKREADYDLFDQCFTHYFAGAERPRAFEKALNEWLQDPLAAPELSSEDIALMEMHDLETLQKMFEERLNEQTERHDGGNRWIGTGGTSPFGHGGANPAGIRVGGTGGGGRAVQVAAQRRFKDYRTDLVLDTRQIGMALRRLRRLGREGLANEVDIDETIDATAKNAGELEIMLSPPRENRLKVMLLMDVGGSMDPFSLLVSRLFSAAHQASHFREFNAFYFHNCVYGHLYPNARLRDGMSTTEILHRHPKDTRLIVVGDAHMAPYELTSRYGAIEYWHQNEVDGLTWLKRLDNHFSKVVWLNPIPKRYWAHPTIQLIGSVFPMYELTLDGLEQAIEALHGQ